MSETKSVLIICTKIIRKIIAKPTTQKIIKYFDCLINVQVEFLENIAKMGVRKSATRNPNWKSFIKLQDWIIKYV